MQKEKQSCFCMRTIVADKIRILLSCITCLGAHSLQEIRISFMIPGHTKFAPDRFFGLFKKNFEHQMLRHG